MLFDAMPRHLLPPPSSPPRSYHFSPGLLRERDPDTGETRKQQLVQEYVAAGKAAAPPQPAHGMKGQLAAVVGHRVRGREVRSIQVGVARLCVGVCVCRTRGRCGAAGRPPALRHATRRPGACLPARLSCRRPGSSLFLYCTVGRT